MAGGHRRQRQGLAFSQGLGVCREWERHDPSRELPEHSWGPHPSAMTPLSLPSHSGFFTMSVSVL